MLIFLITNISPDGLRDHNAEKSHVLKPYGIVGHVASASLQGTSGSPLQLRSLYPASTACSTIAQLWFIIPEVVYICGLYLFLYLKWYTLIIRGDFYTR
uniref:Uncharacterized protein n=1 Tax=Chlorobium phaeobacteroides (strain BS1) TaxID=331678 RepID=B3ENI5_CHLPB